VDEIARAFGFESVEKCVTSAEVSLSDHIGGEVVFAGLAAKVFDIGQILAGEHMASGATACGEIVPFNVEGNPSEGCDP